MINYKQLHYFWQVARTGSIARASELLDLTPQTLSGQIGLLEASLEIALFRRVGRGLELTEAGRLALSYADEIFEIGTEMEQTLNKGIIRRPATFRVGVADVMPKSIVCMLLMPATKLSEPIKMVCKEDKLERLLADLAIHRFDLILSDRPMPTDINIKCYSKLLIECGVSFFATPELAAKYSGTFPMCLHNAPLLLPTDDTSMRKRLVQWLDTRRIHVNLVGEFDDSALMKAFGKVGAGIFIAPSILKKEIEHQYGVIEIGRIDEVAERFYAISTQRRAMHPAVLAINNGAYV